jgi:diadenosine tetraphosphate (Ap4A) HIT family hydrolase
MPNPTMTKFGHPETLIRDYRHWCVLLRPAQATLGALVLVCKDEAEAFSDISPAAFAELAEATGDIEGTLSSFRRYQKINYLMLMMVDRDVHFHVLPRYEESQEFAGTQFPDPGWPAVPDLGAAVKLDETLKEGLVSALRDIWPGGGAA